VRGVPAVRPLVAADRAPSAGTDPWLHDADRAALKKFKAAVGVP
jgi:hypothetical protein